MGDAGDPYMGRARVAEVNQWRFKKAMGLGRENSWNHPKTGSSGLTMRLAGPDSGDCDAISLVASRPN